MNFRPASKKGNWFNNFDIVQRFFFIKLNGFLIFRVLRDSFYSETVLLYYQDISEEKKANYFVCFTSTIIPDAITKCLVSKQYILLYCVSVYGTDPLNYCTRYHSYQKLLFIFILFSIGLSVIGICALWRLRRVNVLCQERS